MKIKLLYFLIILIFKSHCYAFENIHPNVLKKVYLQNKENILTQEMLHQSNCIYIIQNEYNLNGKEITIPEGCILQFEGGSLNNGSLVSNCPIKISSEQYQIFNNIKFNTSIDGIVYSAWFGMNEKNEDNSNCINEAINSASEKLIITTKNIHIKISNPIIINKKINIEFGGTIIANAEMDFCISIEPEVTRNGITINNLCVDCNKLTNIGIMINAGNRHVGNNITIKGFKKYGIFAQKKGKIEPRIDFNNIIIDNSYDIKNCIGIFYDISDSTISNVEIRNCTIGIDVYGGHSVFTNIHAWIIKDTLFPNSCLIRENSYQTNEYISCISDTLQHLVIITRDWVIANFTSPFYFINYSGSITKDLVNQHIPCIVKKTTKSIINIMNLCFDNDKTYKIIKDSEYNPKDNISLETIPKHGSSATLNYYYNEKIHNGKILFNTDDNRWKIFKDNRFFNLSTDNGFQVFHLASGNKIPIILHLCKINKWENYSAIAHISIKGEYAISINISAYMNDNDLQTKIKADKDSFSNFDSYIKLLTFNNNLYLYIKHDCVTLLASSHHAKQLDPQTFNISQCNIKRIENTQLNYTRKSLPQTNSSIEIGSILFDTILNKPLWWTGINWVDANGINVK